jgi:hypothetical protein
MHRLGRRGYTDVRNDVVAAHMVSSSFGGWPIIARWRWSTAPYRPHHADDQHRRTDLGFSHCPERYEPTGHRYGRVDESRQQVLNAMPNVNPPSDCPDAPMCCGSTMPCNGWWIIVEFEHLTITKLSSAG